MPLTYKMDKTIAVPDEWDILESTALIKILEKLNSLDKKLEDALNRETSISNIDNRLNELTEKISSMSQTESKILSKLEEIEKHMERLELNKQEITKPMEERKKNNTTYAFDPTLFRMNSTITAPMNLKHGHMPDKSNDQTKVEYERYRNIEIRRKSAKPFMPDLK